MTLVEHARRELDLCGQTAEDPEYAASLIKAVEAFASYDGHSGGSMMAAVEQLGRLLRFQPLSPLTADPAEWFNHGEMGAQAYLWQSKRQPSVFSTDGGRTWYDMDERNEHGGRVMHVSVPAVAKDGS